MAKAPSKKSETTVTRIIASDSSKSVATKTPADKKPARAAKKDTIVKEKKPKGKNPFKRFAEYFKGSWHELRQVRWPDRRATWGMTGALIAFTIFFVIVILLLDYGFGQLFKLITGK